MLKRHLALLAVFGMVMAACGTDADGDGVTADVDCNDDDPAVGPGSAEVCNGEDDDCDGLTDEN